MMRLVPPSRLGKDGARGDPFPRCFRSVESVNTHTRPPWTEQSPCATVAPAELACLILGTDPVCYQATCSWPREASSPTTRCPRCMAGEPQLEAIHPPWGFFFGTSALCGSLRKRCEMVNRQELRRPEPKKRLTVRLTAAHPGAGKLKPEPTKKQFFWRMCELTCRSLSNLLGTPSDFWFPILIFTKGASRSWG